MLIDKDREIYKKIFECLDFENYKTKRGEIKSTRFNYSKCNFRDRVIKCF